MKKLLYSGFFHAAKESIWMIRIISLQLIYQTNTLKNIEKFLKNNLFTVFSQYRLPCNQKPTRPKYFAMSSGKVLQDSCLAEPFLELLMNDLATKISLIVVTCLVRWNRKITIKTSIIKLIVSIGFVTHQKFRRVEFWKCIFKIILVI